MEMAPCKSKKCFLEMVVGSNEVLIDDPSGVSLLVIMMVIMDDFLFFCLYADLGV
jgi:hypothetical protein